MKKILLLSIVCLTTVLYADNIDKEWLFAEAAPYHDDTDPIGPFYNFRDKDGNIDKTEG